MTAFCRCGHIRTVHEHYTSGIYCSSCECNRYKPRRMRWWQFWRRA